MKDKILQKNKMNLKYYLKILYKFFFFQTYLFWMIKSSRLITKIYFLIYRNKGSKSKISKSTELLIDGPMRSANHFALFYIKKFNNISISHHFHSPGSIRLAYEKKIPTLLLIRNPIDQIASTFIYLENVPLKRVIKSYKIFYEKCLIAKDWYIVADFQDVINNPEKMVIEINLKYNLNLKYAHLDEKLNKSILNDIQINNSNLESMKFKLDERTGIPNLKRNVNKDKIKQILKKNFYNELHTCNKIYQSIINDK